MRKKSAPIRPERDRDIFRVLHAIKGMSAVDIAKKTYVSQQTIRNWPRHPLPGARAILSITLWQPFPMWQGYDLR